MKSLIKKIISFTSTISLIWSLAACSVDATDSKSEPSPKRTVATPVFTVESGEVTSGTTVEITCSTEGAAIYYTTDGSVPTAESTRYTTPITIEPPMTVKAIAIKDGMNDSAVAEVEYTKLIVDYFEGLSDFYGRCDIFNGSNSYKVEKLSDKKIYCTYYSDSEGKNELSKEILTYSVSGDIASLKGESGTEFAIYIKTKDFIVKNIIFDGTIYDLNQVWISFTSEGLSNFLADLPNNTKDTPYKIKLLDLTDGTKDALMNTNKFVSLTMDKSVTSIGWNAFRYCSILTSITIPDSVTSIGDYAFDFCSSLTSITIPNSVTSIGNYAFERCSSLTSITIPNSVILIGIEAFSDCRGLVSIMVDPDNRNYMSSNGVLFNKDQTNLIAYPCGNKSLNYTIPNSVTSISSYAFEICTSLTSITIPDSVTSIGDFAFRYCSSLTSITIPNSVTSIGDEAFDSCSSLSSITIPDSVTSIGWHVFRYCSSLTSITIPDSVTSIGKYAFERCSSLTSITIPDSVTSIDDRAFYNCSSLSTINYKGTQEQWNAISKGSLWNEGVPSTCVINYNYQE